MNPDFPDFLKALIAADARFIDVGADVQLAEPFGRECSVVTRHIHNAYQKGELDPAATCANFAQVRTEGARMVTREVEHYNPLEDGR